MGQPTNDATSRLSLEYEESLQFLHDVLGDARLSPRLECRKLSWKRPAARLESTLDLPLFFPSFEVERDYFPDPSIPKLTAEITYAREIASQPPPCTLLLIRAGQAALARFEDQEMVERLVVRKYMVRGKQGKAQITHLKTKGKSRLGSRIRLQESFEFFEEINAALTKWGLGSERAHESIYYACPVRLWPFVFESKVAPPFRKNDPRLVSIPLHVNRPNLAELEKVYRRISRGTLREPQD